jgi:hypothetical protein
VRVLRVAIIVALLCGAFVLGRWSSERVVLDPTIDVVVAEAALGFEARLDTGAVVSSINARNIQVIDGEGAPSINDVGRQIRFELVNAEGESRELTTSVAQVRGIRMADCREVRYHVYLTVVYRDQAFRILTNLNDRAQAADKLLLGRNWLSHGYAVGPVTEVEI